MKNYLKVDIANARLVMDRTFAKNCAIAGSAEYNLLQSARKDYPNFTVEQRTIKRNANKECYRGLTYEYMKKYIASHNLCCARGHSSSGILTHLCEGEAV